MSDKKTITENEGTEWKQRSYRLETVIGLMLAAVFLLSAVTAEQTPEAAAKAALYRPAGSK